MPAGGDADEFERGAAEAEGAAGGDADRDPVEDQGGAVVDHRLAFDQQPHPLGGAEAAEDRGRGDGVGGGEDGAEHRRLGPAQLRDQRVGDDGDDGRGDEDEADREQRQRPHQRPQLQRRGAPAGRVDERRQEDEEDHVGVEFDFRQPRDQRDPEPAEHQHDRRRDVAELGEADQQRRRQQQDQDGLDVVHDHITSGSVDERLSPPLEDVDHVRGEPRRAAGAGHVRRLPVPLLPRRPVGPAAGPRPPRRPPRLRLPPPADPRAPPAGAAGRRGQRGGRGPGRLLGVPRRPLPGPAQTLPRDDARRSAATSASTPSAWRPRSTPGPTASGSSATSTRRRRAAPPAPRPSSSTARRHFGAYDASSLVEALEG